MGMHILTDLFLLAMPGICYQLGWIPGFYALSALVLPIVMFRSFAIMHEAVHGAASKAPWNDMIGIFYGGVALLAYEPWKRAHLLHHQWSGNIERDPVMALLIVYPKFPAWLKTLLNTGWRVWFPVLGIMQHIVFWSLSFRQFKAKMQELKSGASLLWPPAFWGSLLVFSSPTFLIYSVIPGVLLYLIWVEIVNLPHHLMLPQNTGDLKSPAWEQHRYARSCIYPRMIEHVVTLNFNYHSEHHMFPDLAWHQLSQVHELLQAQLGEDLNTDLQFAWTFRNRREALDQILKRAPESKGHKKAS